MLFLDLSNCGPSAVLKVFYFFKLLLDILFVAIPIGLIVLLIIDFAKMVVSGDESAQKKIFKLATKRIIYAVVVFFVPTIVNIFCSVMSEFGATFTSCYSDVTIDAINQLAAEEEAIKEAEKAAKLALIAEQRAEEEEERQLQEQMKEEIEDTQEENNPQEGGSDTSPSDNGNDDNFGSGSSGSSSNSRDVSGCDGMVWYDVTTGIFYRPDSSAYPNGKEEFRGSAPYGYNKFFYEKLMNLVNAGKSAGYTITPSSSADGAFRSYERQQYFYSCYTYQSCNNGNLAAKPGTSNHGWGIASDLSYGSGSAITWAHNNASKYGLNFSVASENWHIDPIVIKVDNSVVELCK